MRNIALLLLGLVTIPAHALTKVDLYRSEVVLEQEQKDADAKARIEGMKQVIVRASGDTDAINNEVIVKALNQSSQYVTQLSYGRSGESQTLQMGFSAPHIRSLLSQAQLPFWPENRANLLVWLVEDSNFDRNISWEHSGTPLLNAIKTSAEQRGLPLTLPVGDFDDISGIAVSDLWGGFVQPLSAASQRYPADAVLVVRAQGNNLRWTLYDQNPSTMQTSTKVPVTGSSSGQSAAADMVADLADYYAKKNAVVVASESSETVKAEFTMINDAADFFELENKLKALSSVASLDILKIQGSSVLFNVHLLASEEDFEQEVLRMGKVIKVEPQDVAVPVQLPETEQPPVPVNLPENAEPTTLPEVDTVESQTTDAQNVTVSTADGSVVNATEPLEVAETEPLEPVDTTLNFEWQ
ncbi:DUF2066 domain-containing protein [Vibrio paucivorans]|uniref:DUF2066 domain-containing protein n=1 Tax=Vibrio paucivorans TaxID=2829489 RepID=A0A9X3HS56_9VIBR|nr:DUF2066 domain-containing protein [Vibrio paucivorans]MCW8334513.1 DUF2066 domain-containing protein [Vibrio paucivorans]